MSVATTIQLLDSAALTADGTTDYFKIPTATMGELHVEVVSGAGTISAFDLWAQSQAEAGASPVDMLWDRAVKTADAAAEGSARTNVRDVVDGKTTTTAEQFWAKIDALAATRLRLKWKLSGTAPTLTLNAWLVVK